MVIRHIDFWFLCSVVDDAVDQLCATAVSESPLDAYIGRIGVDIREAIKPWLYHRDTCADPRTTFGRNRNHRPTGRVTARVVSASRAVTRYDDWRQYGQCWRLLEQ